MKLYGIPNCNTVKKARDWLAENNVAYEFHDFKKLGIVAKTLEGWLTLYPWEKLVNRAGMTWRNLSNAEKAAVIDNASAIHLMMSKPSVIKRPVALRANRVEAIGFVESEYEKLKT
jgi:Spx/MgsR family transcriptional regulator